MSYQNRASGLVNDYMTLRSIPAMLSVAFIGASLYQFGGISTIDLSWLNYTLTAEHSVMVSLGAFVVAFMSSETKQFQNYEDWEKVAIAVGPLVILGDYLTVEVSDMIMQLGDPLGFQLAFLATIVSWAVAVR